MQTSDIPDTWRASQGVRTLPSLLSPDPAPCTPVPPPQNPPPAGFGDHVDWSSPGEKD